MALFDDVFANILKVEGESYTNKSLDAGGPTKYGITIEVYNECLGTSVNSDVIQSMTVATAKTIYKTCFWLRLQLDRVAQIDEGLARIIFDQAVNRGRFGAIRQLQRALNSAMGYQAIGEDGILGDQTLRLIEKMPNKKVLALQFLIDSQISYVRIVKNNPSQVEFLEGWLRRTHELFKTYFL